MKRILNTRKNRNDTNCSVELVQKRVIPVAAMSEYAEAVANGFVGTFEDYQKYKASLTSALLQPQLDVINIRLDNLEGSVTRLGQELDLLDDRVTDIEANIIIQEGLIQSKVSQTEFDNLKGTVTSQGTQISQNSQAITLKAEKSTVDALGNRVSDNEATLSVHAGLIQSKVSQTDFDALSGTVSQQSTQISQNAQQINLRATQTSVDALGNRVTTAESNITQNAEQISLRVTQGEIESNFSMRPNEIQLFSKKIVMTGMIQFNSMDDSTKEFITTIDGGRITTNSITSNKIAAGAITADKLDVGVLTVDTLRTATTGEKTTIGYKPESPDFTSNYSKHGLRYYDSDSNISFYLGETEVGRSSFITYRTVGSITQKAFEIRPWSDSIIFYSGSNEAMIYSGESIVNRRGGKIEFTKGDSVSGLHFFSVDELASSGYIIARKISQPTSSSRSKPILKIDHFDTNNSSTLYTGIDASKSITIISNTPGAVKVGDGMANQDGFTGVINGAQFVNGICVGTA